MDFANEMSPLTIDVREIAHSAGGLTVQKVAVSTATGSMTRQPSMFVLSLVHVKKLLNLGGGPDFQVDEPFPLAVVHLETLAALIAQARIVAEMMDIGPQLETLTGEAYRALKPTMARKTGPVCIEGCDVKVGWELGHMISVDHEAGCPGAGA
jgi:hypothetical protein